MKYAGLDLSLTGTGICIHDGATVEVLKTISTTPKQFRSRFERIDSIAACIQELLPPQDEVVICIEESFIHPERMAGQQDVLNLAYAVRRSLYYAEYSWKNVAAMSLKKFVMGKGKGYKDMISKEVFKEWGIDAADNNQGDAAGLSKLAEVIHLLSQSAMPTSIPQYRIDVARKVMAGK